jgi:hypothetical protein
MFNTERVRQRIELASIAEGDLSPSDASAVAFHMTDWLSDLERYIKLCNDPESHTDEQVNAILLALLVHAPNHMAAAAKLYADLPVSDIFCVGAVTPRAV